MSTGARKFAEARDASGNTVIAFMAPPRSDDALSEALRILTFYLQRGSDGEAGGLFGGPHGYGAAFENDIFMMHPYCWCEKDDCLWCGGRCGCDVAPCRFFIDDEEVSGQESHRRNEEFLGPMPHEKYEHDTPEYKAYAREWDARVKERDRRWRTLYPAVVHTCEHRMFVDRPEGDTWEPIVSTSAPHFWHKPTGLRVRWYKYIGRDMEVFAGSATDVGSVLLECLRSIGVSDSLESACEAYGESRRKHLEEEKRAMDWWLSDEGRKVMDDLLKSGAVHQITFGPPPENT